MSSPVGRTNPVLFVLLITACFLTVPGYAQECANPVDTTGTIEFFNPNVLNGIGVGEVFYLLSPNTLFQDAEGNNISPGDFMVGDEVTVLGCREGIAPPMARVVRHLPPPGEDPGDPDPNEVQIEGDITSIHYDSGNLVVDGEVEVFTDDETEIVGHSGDPIPFDDLNEGDRVLVDGIELTENAAKSTLRHVAATRIEVLEEAPDPDQIEVSGKVTSIHEEYGKLILDSNIYVYTNEETEILDEEGDPISFDEIKVDDRVTARGYEWSESDDKHERQRIRATRVQVIERDVPDTIEFDGKITRIDENDRELFLGDRKIRTNDETRFEDHAGDPIDFEDFHVGEKIHVVAYADKTFQTVLAILVKKKDAPQPIEFSGRIDSINQNDGSLVVNNRMVRTNDETEYLSKDGEPLGLSDFKVGERVEVRGHEVADGKTATPVLATRIKKQQGELDDIRFEGEIVAIHHNEMFFHVGDRRVLVTEDTVFQGENGGQLSFGDLEKGDRVEVEGYVLKTVGSIVAVQVTLLEAGPPEGDPLVEGVLRAFVEDENLLVVDHTLVEYNQDTEFLDHEGHSIRVRDLRKGDKLKVYGERLVDDSVLAHVIVRTRRHGDRCEQKVKGVITEINDASKTLVVGMLRFQTDEETQILGMENALIDFSDLLVGDKVEVYFCPDSAVPPIADKIRVKGHESDEATVQGFVLQVDLDAMALVVSGDYQNVTGVYVRTDANTDFRDDSGDPIGLEDFAVQDLVRAKGMPLPDGSLEASEVHKLEIDGGCDGKLHGFLTDLDPGAGTLVVGIVEIQTNENTVILDADGNPIELMDLEIGVVLDVRFCSGIGTPVANRIRVRAYDNYDFEDDGEVGHNDAVRIIRDCHRGRYHLDLSGDGINTHHDLFLFSNGWGRGGRR